MYHEESPTFPITFSLLFTQNHLFAMRFYHYGDVLSEAYHYIRALYTCKFVVVAGRYSRLPRGFCNANLSGGGPYGRRTPFKITQPRIKTPLF